MPVSRPVSRPVSGNVYAPLSDAYPMPACGITLWAMASVGAPAPTPPRLLTSPGGTGAEPAPRGGMGIIGIASADPVAGAKEAGVDPSPCTAALDSPLGTDPGQVAGTDTALMVWA